MFVPLQKKVDQMKQEESDLMRQIQQVQDAIKEEGDQNDYLREQADVRRRPVCSRTRNTAALNLCVLSR